MCLVWIVPRPRSASGHAGIPGLTQPRLALTHPPSSYYRYTPVLLLLPTYLWKTPYNRFCGLPWTYSATKVKTDGWWSHPVPRSTVISDRLWSQSGSMITWTRSNTAISDCWLSNWFDDLTVLSCQTGLMTYLFSLIKLVWWPNCSLSSNWFDDLTVLSCQTGLMT